MALRVDTPTVAEWKAIARCGAVQFGLTPRQMKLVGESENIVVDVRSERKRYTLRLHDPSWHSLDTLASELVWLQHLRARGIRVSEPVVSPMGRLVEVVSFEGTDRPITCLHWIVGRLQSRWSYRAAGEAGHLMARMHEAAEEFSPPETFSRPVFDAEGLIGDRATWGDPLQTPIAPTEQRVLRRALEGARQHLAELSCNRDRFGMIHNDLHAHNVVRHGGNLWAIDFDDCGFGWYAADLETTRLSMARHADPERLWNELTKAYRKIRPLPPEQETHALTFQLLQRSIELAWVDKKRLNSAVYEFWPLVRERCMTIASRWIELHG